MTDIKVGQVLTNGKSRIVITKKDKEGFYMIWNDGIGDWYSVDFIEYKFRLLATYPTWQEAVNSPIFKGE